MRSQMSVTLGLELNEAISSTIAHLLHTYVPEDEMSRLALKAQADKKDREASYQRGMADNYSTASQLNWEADMCRLAAESRFPRQDDNTTLDQYSRIIQISMVQLIQGLTSDDAHYNDESVSHTLVHSAIEEAVDLSDLVLVNKLIEQLADQNLIEKSEIDFWKEDYQTGLKLKQEQGVVNSAASKQTQRINVPTPKIDETIKSAIVHLLRKENIPLSMTRDQIMEKAREISREGSLETSWDNYTSGARLQFQASVYRLAAAVRYPRDEDTEIQNMKSRIEYAILDQVIYEMPNEDASESSRVNREMMLGALRKAADLDDGQLLRELVDEFAAKGDIGNPEEIKNEIESRTHERNASFSM